MIPPRSPWRVAHPSPWPERASAEGLLDDGADAIPVRVTIYQEKYVTGWDDGALGFDEDTVWFSGRAMSFRLVANDVIPWPDEALVRTAPRLGIGLRHPTREIGLSFRVIVLPVRKEWEDEETVEKALKRLIATTDALGKSQYPPLWPRPGFASVPRVEWASVQLRWTFWGWLFERQNWFCAFFVDDARDRLVLQSAAEERRE